jgi:hypothetical protein
MWGTDSPAAICRAARRMGYDRLALTDTDNLYGLWKFVGACHAEGLTPIVGVEISDPNKPHRAICPLRCPVWPAACWCSPPTPICWQPGTGQGSTRQRPCPGGPHSRFIRWCKRLDA